MEDKQSRGCPGHLIPGVQEAYQSNTTVIDLAGKVPEEVKGNQGERQGSSLSRLYLIYISTT
jgi:hypothetical protein